MIQALQDPRNGARSLGLFLACLVYVVFHLIGFPVLAYLPIEDTWTFNSSEEAVKIGYFGLLAYVGIAYVVGWSVGQIGSVQHFLMRRSRLLTDSTGSMVVAAMGYFFLSELARWA
jgi:putative flippase GtrA